MREAVWRCLQKAVKAGSVVHFAPAVYTGDVGTALSKITNPGRKRLEQAFIWRMSVEMTLAGLMEQFPVGWHEQLDGGFRRL
jgi:hypothetical protein